MTPEQKAKCKVISEYYGAKRQEIQALQEFSEFTILLTKRPDQRKNMKYQDEIKDEIADCLIMLEQIRQLNGVSEDAVAEVIEFKLDRQLNRIREDAKRKEVQQWKD